MSLQPTANLTVTQPAGSGDVFVSILGTDPTTGTFSYLDFTTGKLVAYSSYKSLTTSQLLSSLKMPVGIPAMKSARIYFAVGTDFDTTTFPAQSGPSSSKNQTVMFDKVEFDTSSAGNFNINSTNVDFYALSYTMSLQNQSGDNVSVGLSSTRTEILTAMSKIPVANAGKNPGNTEIYQQLFVTDSKKNVVRYIAPKAAALTDWGSYSQEFTHYLDDYIRNKVFVPNRQFSFYDKFYPNPKNTYYGQISSDGTTMSLYTDSARKNLYLTLNRPMNGFGKPDFKNDPQYFHNTSGTENNQVDWGFLLLGNVAGTGLAADWGSDPAAMAILVSICRGVAHLDDGCTEWVKTSGFYQGDAGKSTENQPIEYYSKILHANAPGGAAYTLSYDDVYGQNSSVFFNSGQAITIALTSIEKVVLS
ncbi:MAG: hypothetical protein FD123_1251 [Bacteroidetes bacterium]|nr:MAG: hypothetical protein FD123_1251 [Bacteroidota bacterium]